MSRFVKGFNPDNISPGATNLPKTGGTVIGNISSGITPTNSTAAITRTLIDAATSGGSLSPCNGQRVFSLLAGQASGWYGHSSTVTCNWTVPSSTNRVFIQVWGGGGGGGGYRCRDHGTPGGAGGYSHGFFNVSAGDILCIQAGRGGCRGCCQQHGFAGAISFVCNAARGIAIRAYPGSGGCCSFQQVSGEGGSPGTGAGGQFNLSGQREHSDTQCSCHRYCDGRAHAFALGAAPFTFGGYMTFASPGNGTYSQAAYYCQNGGCGLPNCSPGGGGSHGGHSYPGNNKGGSGGPGLVMIWH